MSYFPSVSLSYVSRVANQAAHWLAKFLLRTDRELVWLEEIPYLIVYVVLQE